MQPVDLELAFAQLISPKGKPVALSPLSTPLSGISKAPMTPMLSLLPEPFFDAMPKFSRTRSGDSTPDAKFVRTVSGASTQVPDESEYNVIEEFGWDHVAQSTSAAEVKCTGTTSAPSLQSDLGQWAQAVIRAEEWLEYEWIRKQEPSRLREFLVHNTELRADTVGLAFRKSKDPWDRDHSLPGPRWGTTVAGFDEGDGWVKVGRHFLPLELGGANVLVQKIEPLWDGPALTPDGQVVDLEHGAAIFFSHDRSLAGSWLWKAQLKEEAGMIAAARLAHKACEAEALIEADEVCSIDEAGKLRGVMPPAAEGQRSLGLRLKMLHRKRQARKRAGSRQSGSEADPCLCAGLDGKVCLLLAVESAEHRERLRIKRAKLMRPLVVLEEDWDQSPTLVVDVEGVVHM